MLVLSRKAGESIAIGDNITITITRMQGNRVGLAIDAPRDVSIVRSELDQGGNDADRNPVPKR